jgi:hypothetical protein
MPGSVVFCHAGGIEMNPSNNKGTLGKLPPDIWCNITKFLKPQDIVALKTASRDVSAELDSIHTPLTADKWEKKLAKFLGLMDDLKNVNLKLAKLSQEIKRSNAISPENAKTVNDYLGTYDTTAKMLKDKIAKVKLRRLLNAQQHAQLAEIVRRMQNVDTFHESQKKQVMTAIAEVTKVMVKKKEMLKK